MGWPSYNHPPGAQCEGCWSFKRPQHKDINPSLNRKDHTSLLPNHATLYRLLRPWLNAPKVGTDLKALGLVTTANDMHFVRLWTWGYKMIQVEWGPTWHEVAEASRSRALAVWNNAKEMVGMGQSLGFWSTWCSSQGPIAIKSYWLIWCVIFFLNFYIHVWLPWEWFCKGGGAEAARERDLRRGWLRARGWPASRSVDRMTASFHEVIDSVSRLILVSGRATQILVLSCTAFVFWFTEQCYLLGLSPSARRSEFCGMLLQTQKPSGKYGISLLKLHPLSSRSFFAVSFVCKSRINYTTCKFLSRLMGWIWNDQWQISDYFVEWYLFDSILHEHILAVLLFAQHLSDIATLPSLFGSEVKGLKDQIAHCIAG